MNAIFNLTGDIIGYASDDRITLPPGQTMVELPDDWQDEWADDAVLIDGELVIEPAAKLAQVQTQRKAKIKREAAVLISASDWRVTRAQERQTLNLSGDETLETVLAYRESIRRASSRAEDEVDFLTSVTAVRAYTWAITAEDQVEIEEL